MFLIGFCNKLSPFFLQYEEAFQRLNIERDQLAQQYQQYIDQLNSQSTQLQTQVQPLVNPKGCHTDTSSAV